MNTVEQISIVTAALAVLPAHARDDHAGQVWIRLTELLAQGKSGEDLLQALKNHARYLHKRDAQAVVLEPSERGADDSSLTMLEIKDELSKFSPQDRSIIISIMAGESLRTVAERKGASASTLHRRLKRLRGVA